MTTKPVSSTKISVGRRAGRYVGLAPAAALLVLLAMASIALGSRDVALIDVWNAVTGVSQGADATVIRDMRVPRTLLGILVGAALALGGVILQGTARNPLADPGVLGISQGAAAMVVVAALAFGTMPAGEAVWFAFAGAGIATVIVYSVASFGAEGATPVKLALAGAALTALCASITSAILLADPDALNELRMWQVGALAGRYAPVLGQLLPFFVVGIVGSLFVGRALNLLSLGDDLARTLGMKVEAVRTVLFVLVAALCGAATAACGPIVFVGLMIPHLVRLITGPDYRWILVYSALLGPVLVLGADIAGRLLLPSGEIPVGVVIGIVGAPVFVLLVRFRRSVQL